MANLTTHNEQVVALKRIEGQIRGIQKMIVEKRYCVDILTQLHSIVGAISRVEDKILKKHLEGCVSGTFKGQSEQERNKKIDEVMTILQTFRKV